MSDHAPDPAPDHRARPVGGAAARRRTPERPVYPAHDERREVEHYPRASLGAQAVDAIRQFVRNRAALGVVAFIVGGWLVLRLLTPPVVMIDELRVGDCLYVRTPAGVTEGKVGPDSEVRTRLLDAGAERAGCTLSHSHEVAAVIPLTDSGWPGDPTVVATTTAACEAAMARIAAPSADPPLDIVPVAPDEARWERGVRTAVCLVRRADAGFLDRDVVP